MRVEVIGGYEERLAEEPDNLALREVLAQTYFWNGWKDRGISEYFNILINQAFEGLLALEKDSEPLLSYLDVSYGYRYYFRRLASMFEEKKRDLQSAVSTYESARTGYEKFQAQTAKAKEEGEEPPKVEGEDPLTLLGKAEESLSAKAEVARRLLDDYSQLSKTYLN